MIRLSNRPSSNSPPVLINLDRDKLTFCSSKSGAPLVFPFPDGAIRDLEIINFEALSTQLKLFLDTHKIPPANLVMILSPRVYFEKNLAHLSEDERQNQTQTFLDYVPFSSPGSKIYHLSNEFKIVAFNRDLYESFKAILEPLGFILTDVVPFLIFANLGQKSDELTGDSCRLISKRLDYIHENSFITADPAAESLVHQPRHYLNRHSFIFAVISLGFVVMLGITAYFTVFRRPTRKLIVIPGGLPPIIAVTLAPSPQPTTVPVATSSSQLTITILNGSTVPGLSARLKTELIPLGLTNIITGNATVSAKLTTIEYSAFVPVNIRREINSVVAKLFATVQPQDATGSAVDVMIITGPQK